MGKIFDDIIEGTKTVADVAFKKAGKAIDFSKLKFNSADLNRKISNIYEKIGRATYESIKNNIDKTEEINQHIAAVDNLYIQLDAINEQISSLGKNEAVCKCNCKESKITNIESCSCVEDDHICNCDTEKNEK